MEKKGWKKCKIRKLNYLISILIYCIDINISLYLILKKKRKIFNKKKGKIVK